ncbi:unnamed protein product [Sphagnum troendelagicum]|uniref:50S ribosomal protein L17, chloroplastic n=1 Tax=Sphagnum troendelagicum TaxID=128251 RepID=A0ABP0U0G9_9BRYO
MPSLSSTMLDPLLTMMYNINPYVKVFKMAKDMMAIECAPTDLKLRLIASRTKNARRYNVPTADEVATLMVGDGPEAVDKRSSFSVVTFGVSNGTKWFAMRHGRKVPKLNRPPDQRRALLRGLTTELLRHGRIKTTRARASAMRKYVDHMITLAKGGTLHQRRQALGFLYDKQLVHSLFAEVPERYGERNGGYTRIIRTMPRRGDNAPMAFIELV